MSRESENSYIKTVPIGKDYYTEEADGTVYLRGSRCGLCGDKFYPAKTVCSTCVSDEDIQEIKMRGRGNLYTWTVIERAAPGFFSPYWLSYIDLEDGGPRVLFQLAEHKAEDLEFGMEMEAFIGPIREDKVKDGKVLVVGPKFRPVKG